MSCSAGRFGICVLVTLSLLFAGFVVGGVAAQTREAGGTQQQGVKEANATQDWDASSRVERLIEEWKTADPVGRRFQERHANGKISLVEGIALASFRTDDKRWGKARSLAYTQAFIDATKQYVERTEQRIKNTSLRKYFEQDLDESELVYQPGETSDDYLSRVLTKAAALGERKLDQALAESGMSPDEIERMTPPQKKTTFSDVLSRRGATEAFGSANGLIPVKTFEAYDNEGNSAVGVVAVASPRMRHLARQVAKGKPIRPDRDRARSPVADQVSALSDEDLLSEFGPRVWWDEHGYPTIVAFGQWAWSSAGLDKRKKARRRAFAKIQASSDAKAHLTTFINASTRFTEVDERGIEVEEFSRVSADGTVGEEETAKLLDKVFRTARVSSTVNLTGLKVLRRWFRSHPDLDGHELVGAVIAWSPAQEDQVRAELGKSAKHRPTAKRKVQKSRASGKTVESRNLMDPADF